MMKREDAVDSFTLLHHDLNICTNSVSLNLYHSLCPQHGATHKHARVLFAIPKNDIKIM